MNTHKNLVSSEFCEIEPQDRKALCIGRRIGISGMVLLLVGATGLIASAGQQTWDIDQSFYLVLVLFGPLAVLRGQMTLRAMMKKYLQPFHFVA